MANEIDKPIESLDTEWEGYLGSRIEAYLKQFLQNLDSKKHGDWLLTSDDNGLTTLRAFADTDSKKRMRKTRQPTSRLCWQAYSSILRERQAQTTPYLRA
jgi:hypothetical protein